MRVRACVLGLAALFLVPFAACGKKPPVGPTSEAVESDLASLVPSDAMVFVHTPSLDSLLAKMRGLVAVADPVRAAGMDVGSLLQAASAADHVDLHRPAAFALAPSAGEDPVATYIVPTKDPSAFVRATASDSRGAAFTATQGKYLAVTMGTAPAARGGGLGARAPDGDLGLRVDMTRLNQEIAPFLDRMVDRTSGPAGPLFASVRSFLASAESLDVAVRIDGTHVDILGELRAKEGSLLATGAPVGSDRLADLAGRLPRDFPFTAIGSVDPEAAARRIEEILGAWVSSAPDEVGQRFGSFARGMREVAAHLGNEHAVGLGVGAQGLEVVGISAAKDAPAFVTKIQSLVAASLESIEEAVPFEALPPVTAHGVEVRAFRIGITTLTVDRSTDESSGASFATLLFGDEGFVCRAAAVEGRVVWTIGGGQALVEQAIASAKKPGSAPAVLAAPIRKAGGKATFLLAMDYRALASQIVNLLRVRLPRSETARLPTIPPGRPATFTVYVTSEGRVYRGGVSVDVGAWIETLRPFVR